MKSNATTKNFLWYYWAWSIPAVIQLGACYVISYLMVQYVFTDDRITAWSSSPGGPISSLPFMVKIGEFEKLIYSFIRSEIFVGGCFALFFFKSLINKKSSFNFWVILILCFLGLLGLGVLSGWLYAFIALAECVPACGWTTLKYGNSPELKSGDFHNMGGEFYRGAQLIKWESGPKAFAKLSADEGGKGINLFPGCPYVYQRENEHFLAVGSPGSGKTQIIHSWAEEVYKRPEDKAIIWDVKGLFTQSFVGRPGVDLLAAWDQRSMGWSPMEDIKDPLDCPQMASYFIPDNPNEPQDHFPDSARQVLSACFYYLYLRGTPWGWGDLWEIISRSRKELCALLGSFEGGRHAANLIAGDNSRSADDVYKTLSAKTQGTIRWFAQAWPKGGQSLRKWVHSDSKFLILGGIPERSELANATANIAFPLIVKEILSLEDDPKRRRWLFLDELATLGKIDALLDACLTGRSKGVCVVAGIQDMGKMEHNIGRSLASSLSNSFGTKIILRCSDVGTSQWASKVLGDQDVFEKQVSVGESSEGLFSKTIKTTSEQNVLRTRSVFNPTEVANMPNLTGVLQVSSWPLLMFRWAYQSLPKNAKLVETAAWLSQKPSLSDDGSSDKGPTNPWKIDT